MWQYVLAGLIVALSAVYALIKLAPRAARMRWLQAIEAALPAGKLRERVARRRAANLAAQGAGCAACDGSAGREPKDPA